MSRTLKTDVQGPDWRRSFDEVHEKGVDALYAPDFAPPFPLVVEVGFGRGEFLMELCRNQPEVAFLGVELSHKRAVKMARRVALSEIGNLRLIEARGQEVLRDLVPEGRAREVWVNFPDPWPKKRHAARRLVQASFVATVARALEPEGTVRIATDHIPYAEQIHEILVKESLLENAYAPAPWVCEVTDRSRTAYELAWRSEGRPLHFFAYRRSGE